MEFIYSTGLRIYSLLLKFVSLFHGKARLMMRGRKDSVFRLKNLLKLQNNEKSVWFHFASLGEFEQGRPVIESFKNNYSDFRVYITFYSPSGYEIRKNSPLADAVFYLPEDSANNARLLLNAFKPSLIIFTKYEYWHHYFKEANKRSVPLFMISAIFRPDQIYFKKRGLFFRNILKNVTHFFVQNEESVRLLHSIGHLNATITGDTRFDRVLEIVQKPLNISLIETFKNDQNCWVCGSTWLEDEKNLALIFANNKNWKFILAPHEISEQRIEEVVNLFPDSLKYSDLKETPDSVIKNAPVLIVDNIGMLSSLYQYADIAYIGGGFGVGIHNILEAAAFGKPVVFGPEYHKFNEAKELIKFGGAFSYQSADELKILFESLKLDQNRRNAAEIGVKHIQKSAGATTKIMGFISKYLS